MPGPVRSSVPCCCVPVSQQNPAESTAEAGSKMHTTASQSGGQNPRQKPTKTLSGRQQTAEATRFALDCRLLTGKQQALVKNSPNSPWVHTKQCLQLVNQRCPTEASKKDSKTRSDRAASSHQNTPLSSLQAAPGQTNPVASAALAHSATEDPRPALWQNKTRAPQRLIELP